MKKIVHYKPSRLDLIREGLHARVFPIDHPSIFVSNTAYVETSVVIKHNSETGEFETLNSIYKPVKDDPKASCNCCC